MNLNEIITHHRGKSEDKTLSKEEKEKHQEMHEFLSLLVDVLSTSL